MPESVARARKFVVALLGALVGLVAQGVIDGDAAQWVTTAVAVATALGVYAVPNEAPDA